VLSTVLFALAQGQIQPDALEPAYPNMRYIAPDVMITQVSKMTWVFTFLHKLDNGTIYPANGVYTVLNRKGIMIDPGWDDRQAEALYNWSKRVRSVSRVISTHFHLDRTGGNKFFVGKGIPVYTNTDSIRLAKKDGQQTGKWHALALTTGQVKDFAGLKVLYPGPGHAPDNIVVYVPKDRTLYGGCFLKSVTADDLGNLSDANPKQWPKSLEVLKAAFPKATTIIPGHGTVSGNCLKHTLKLLVDGNKG